MNAKHILFIAIPFLRLKYCAILLSKLIEADLFKLGVFQRGNTDEVTSLELGIDERQAHSH